MEIKNLDGTVTISLIEFDKMRNDLEEKTKALEENLIQVTMYDNPWHNMYTNWRVVNYFTNDEIINQFSKQVECLNKLIVEKDNNYKELRKEWNDYHAKMIKMSTCEFRKWRREHR